MANPKKAPDGGDRIWIPKELHNGLKLKMVKERRPSPGNAGADALEHGQKIKAISDAKLAQELQKMGKGDRIAELLPDFKATEQKEVTAR